MCDKVGRSKVGNQQLVHIRAVAHLASERSDLESFAGAVLVHPGLIPPETARRCGQSLVISLLLRHEHRAIAIRGGTRPAVLLSLGTWDLDDRGSAVGGVVAIDLVGSVDVLLVEDDGRAVGRNVAVARTGLCSGVVRELLEGPSGGIDDVLKGRGWGSGKVGVSVGIGVGGWGRG